MALLEAESRPGTIAPRGRGHRGGIVLRGGNNAERCTARTGAEGALARKNMVAVTAWLRRFSTATVSRKTWNVSR